jgi:alpha-2-macroglobulin
VRQLLEELSLNQTEAGFFAYWPGGGGDIQLTAIAVEFLHEARKAGHPVDERPLSSAVEALRRVLRSDYAGLLPEYRFEQKVAALRALTRVGQLDEHYLVDLFHHRERLDLAGVADLAWTMGQKPRPYAANLEALKGDLWNGVVVELARGQPVFKGLSSRRASWGLGYLGSETSTLAAVFEALATVDPTNPRLAVLRDGLISRASASAGFGSTHDNRRALGALGTYLERATHPGLAATVSVGAQKAALGPERLVARIEVADKEQPLPFTASAEVGVRTEFVWLPDAPGHQVTALEQGFIVSRATTVLPADGSAQRRFDDRSGSTLALVSGDVVEVHAKLTSSEDRHHVALIVPFAAGFEPLNPALENAGAIARPSQPDSLRPDAVQRLDHEVRYYFVKLPKGQHGFHFRLRATTPGAFVHPAAWAEQMYRQEVRGRGDGLRVVVEPARAKP